MSITRPNSSVSRRYGPTILYRTFVPSRRFFAVIPDESFDCFERVFEFFNNFPLFVSKHYSENSCKIAHFHSTSFQAVGRNVLCYSTVWRNMKKKVFGIFQKFRRTLYVFSARKGYLYEKNSSLEIHSHKYSKHIHLYRSKHFWICYSESMKFILLMSNHIVESLKKWIILTVRSHSGTNHCVGRPIWALWWKQHNTPKHD